MHDNYALKKRHSELFWSSSAITPFAGNLAAIFSGQRIFLFTTQINQKFFIYLNCLKNPILHSTSYNERITYNENLRNNYL